MILIESTGSFYVGSAVSLTKRMRDHVSKLRRGNHPNKWIQNTYNKHGFEPFKVCVIEYDIPFDSLLETEQIYIDRWYDSQVVCMNMCPTAGSSLGRKHLDETKHKISVANRGQKRSSKQIEQMSEIGKEVMKNRMASGFDTSRYANKGTKHPFFGKNHSQASIDKMSLSSKGIPNNKNGKKVGQFNLEGELLAIYVSTADAERQTGIKCVRQSALNNSGRMAGGFLWKYLLT